jgi:hypothetical protein
MQTRSLDDAKEKKRILKTDEKVIHCTWCSQGWE